jgi:GntR family transcriptional repressor for pyruvate dehydrogenase complex
MKTTINSIINFLHFKSPSIRDITMVRYLLEPRVAQLAASVIQQKDIKALGAMVEGDLSDLQIGFHRYLARMTGNPIMILITDFIDNILRSIKLRLGLGPDFYERVVQHHQGILECLVKRDGEGARRKIIDDIVEVGKYMADLAGVDAFDPTVFEGSDTLPAHGGNDHVTLSGSAQLVAELEKILGAEKCQNLIQRGALFQQVGSNETLLVFRPKSK